MNKSVGAIVPITILAGWEIFWHMPGARYESLSRPVDVGIALVHGLLDGTILLATFQTFQAALLGFALAATLGIIIGVILGLVPPIERIVGPSIDAMRPVPSVALIPLSLMIFGFGVRMEALIVAFACLWPVLIITTSAVRNIDSELMNVARVLQMTSLERLRKIIMPAALARITVGLQLALAIALVVAVTVEIVLNPRGLGHGIMAAQQALRFDQMYALLLWIGLVGWALSYSSQALVDAWSPLAQASRAKGQP